MSPTIKLAAPLLAIGAYAVAAGSALAADQQAVTVGQGPQPARLSLTQAIRSAESSSSPMAIAASSDGDAGTRMVAEESGDREATEDRGDGDGESNDDAVSSDRHDDQGDGDGEVDDDGGKHGNSDRGDGDGETNDDGDHEEGDDGEEEEGEEAE